MKETSLTRKDFLRAGAWTAAIPFLPYADMQANDEYTITPQPSSTSSEKDFDFVLGRWNVRNRKLKTRLNGCTDWLEFDATQDCRKILNGMGNMDQFRTQADGKPFEGLTLRLFNPKTKLWSIYWADSANVVLDTPVLGSFDNGIGKFYANDTFEGKPIRVVFQWDATDPEKPVWSQAFSPDNGKSWEWNWYMYFNKA